MSAVKVSGGQVDGKVTPFHKVTQNDLQFWQEIASLSVEFLPQSRAIITRQGHTYKWGAN